MIEHGKVLVSEQEYRRAMQTAKRRIDEAGRACLLGHRAIVKRHKIRGPVRVFGLTALSGLLWVVGGLIPRDPLQ